MPIQADRIATGLDQPLFAAAPPAAASVESESFLEKLAEALIAPLEKIDDVFESLF